MATPIDFGLALAQRESDELSIVFEDPTISGQTEPILPHLPAPLRLWVPNLKAKRSDAPSVISWQIWQELYQQPSSVESYNLFLHQCEIDETDPIMAYVTAVLGDFGIDHPDPASRVSAGELAKCQERAQAAYDEGLAFPTNDVLTALWQDTLDSYKCFLETQFQEMKEMGGGLKRAASGAIGTN